MVPILKLKIMKTITFKELNKSTMLGTKFTIAGSETVYVFDTCQLIRNGQFTALNTKFNTNSKIGINFTLFLVD